MDTLWLLTSLAYLIPTAVIIVGLTLWFASRQQKTLLVDELWAWLGPGAPWQGNGRTFGGTVDGRAVHVTWFDGTTTLTVEATPAVHAGFGRRDRPVEVIDEAAEGGRRVAVDAEHVGYGETRGDVNLLLGQPGVREALDLLLADDELSIRAVDVEPGKGVVWFARNLRELATTAKSTWQWTNAAVAVARASERPMVVQRTGRAGPT